MRVFARVGVYIIICIVISFFAIGVQIGLDLSSREDDVLTFTRLSVKDALVNIQTTEQEGYDYLASRDKLLPTGAVNYTYEKSKYQKYLSALAEEAGKAGTQDENMQVIAKFLKQNSEDTTGDALFRPVQYGLTYVDPELFAESFKSSMNQLIDANYTKATSYDIGGVSFTTKAPCAVTITGVSYKINDETDLSLVKPKMGTLALNTYNNSTRDEVYRSIYGIDKIVDSQIGTDLGFGSSAINFYVYYDIEVTVFWESASTNQLLTRNFFSQLLGSAIGGDTVQFTPKVNGSQEYLYIPGKPVTYTYRYVLLN